MGSVVVSRGSNHEDKTSKTRDLMYVGLIGTLNPSIVKVQVHGVA